MIEKPVSKSKRVKVRINGVVQVVEFSPETLHKLYEPKKEKKFTVSKIMLALVMASYFAGLLVMLWAAVITVLRRPDDIIPAIGLLSAYIGVPTSTTIGFYSWKAKNENVPKIEKSFENENNSYEANEQL